MSIRKTASSSPALAGSTLPDTRSQDARTGGRHYREQPIGALGPQEAQRGPRVAQVSPQPDARQASQQVQPAGASQVSQPQGEQVTIKQLRRLNRADLLEVLLAQRREIDRLREQVAGLEEQLANRKVQAAQAGSIAQAALQLSGIFEAAQDAANIYLESVRDQYGNGADDQPEGGYLA